MATSVAAKVVLGTPELRRHDGAIRLTIAVLNGGELDLQNFAILSVKLGSAALQSPPVAPLYLKTLGASNTARFAARFSDQGLALGANLMLTVTASYTLNGAAYGLTLNRFVKVPAPVSRPDNELQASIQSSMANGLWDFTLVNAEPVSSTHRIATFALDIRAPVTVTGIPAGWGVETDRMTYVLWFSRDLAPPYPTHVAPGSSLSGFQLAAAGGRSEVASASVVAWNHASDLSGRVFADYVLTPHRIA